MHEVVGAVQRVTDIMAEITAASQEQSAGIEQVNQTVTQLDEMTQQNAALVEESTAAARSLEDQAEQLARAVAVFRPGRRDDVAGQGRGGRTRRSGLNPAAPPHRQRCRGADDASEAPGLTAPGLRRAGRARDVRARRCARLTCRRRSTWMRPPSSRP
jgi:hypothetical protein